MNGRFLSFRLQPHRIEDNKKEIREQNVTFTLDSISLYFLALTVLINTYAYFSIAPTHYTHKSCKNRLLCYLYYQPCFPLTKCQVKYLQNNQINNEQDDIILGNNTKINHTKNPRRAEKYKIILLFLILNSFIIFWTCHFNWFKHFKDVCQ